MKFKIIILYFFVTICCHAQYYVDIHYYIEQDDCFVMVTDTLNTDIITDANEIAFSLFLHAIADYDCDYLSILYKSKEEKSSLMMPYDYRLYCDDGDIELMSRYSLNRLIDRLKNDYWGQKILRLKGLCKKKKFNTQNVSRKKRNIDKTRDRSFTPVPYFD